VLLLIFFIASTWSLMESELCPDSDVLIIFVIMYICVCVCCTLCIQPMLHVVKHVFSYVHNLLHNGNILPVFSVLNAPFFSHIYACNSHPLSVFSYFTLSPDLT